MTKTTLADKVEKNFSKVKLKNFVVKVPKIKKVENAKKLKRSIFLPDDKIPFSSIIKILIKNAIEEAKKEKNEKQEVKEVMTYKAIKDDKEKDAGGYGTISKVYGAAPSSFYSDYGKFFSYLGKFRSQSAYETINGKNSAGSGLLDGDDFSLIDSETIEKGAKFVRYFSNPGLDVYSASLSLVPLGGMGSAEWEQFKLWMQLDKVMYRFKTSTS